MPLAPPSTRLRCPPCGWFKLETHLSDAILSPSSIRCPQCQGQSLVRESDPSGMAALQNWLSSISAKVGR